MFKIHKEELEVNGKKLTLETGKIARQADGAIIATCGETVVIATAVGAKKLKDGQASRENIFPSLQEKSDAKYMFLISTKDIKKGQEITANYNLYTYPKTGIGLQMI